MSGFCRWRPDYVSIDSTMYVYILFDSLVTITKPYIIRTIRIIDPIDTGRKLNAHKTFRRRPGLLNVLCTLNLRPVSMGDSAP